MARLQHKTALITAAGQGIGLATANLFLAEGARVIATDINPDSLQQLNCETHVLDVTNTQAVHDLAAAVGPIDVLFNCVGYVHSGTILDCDEDSWQRSIDMNINSMHRTIRAFLPQMLETGGGSIINMSSVASSIKGAPNRCAYGMTKAAVIGLTKAVAADFVTQGVRCNAICPGTVDTPSLQERLAATGDYEAAHKAFVARQPMGRLGTAQEMAKLALYLASDDSAFTTGTVNIIDGGWSN
ncbi:SDR family oxidoreductase [Gilvimarinus sp. SDUM040013]|uniref:SDR family oxidoreductase n=1 Tax=Gilvimarinus gilvus TaxID=3058038 RepID=A0ABU4S287_9GAMM|nr:SDR family oxidoreductase [Gilvimarinus sp. SDUM040013]MDO3384939.1 SDR family oxidoreductase [Gilvimarinus sp. SDUM040013]MDX6851265.1 SDR family oxidoreductase [Gilvimarinus sp. SDUM040013]